MPQLAKLRHPRWLVLGLAEIGGNLSGFARRAEGPGRNRDRAQAGAHLPADARYCTRVQDMPKASWMPSSKASLLFELDPKINEFQAALKEFLGLDMIAFRTNSANVQGGGPFRGGSADESSRSVSPGEEFLVRVHAAQATLGRRGSIGSGWTAVAATRGSRRTRPEL